MTTRKKNSRTKKRKMAEKAGFRSGFEYDICKKLQRDGIKYEYETLKINWTKPETTHSYTPDVILPSGIIVEIKGRWDLANRKQMLYIIEQHPDLDIRMVFQNAKSKLRKGGKMSYGQWCDQKGIKWAEKEIPSSWY
tara:strand:+ start:397 stop:807 length:411 start_codon:yes stop_codon:yes gene_type:complete